MLNAPGMFTNGLRIHSFPLQNTSSKIFWFHMSEMGSYQGTGRCFLWLNENLVFLNETSFRVCLSVKQKLNKWFILFMRLSTKCPEDRYCAHWALETVLGFCLRFQYKDTLDRCRIKCIMKTLHCETRYRCQWNWLEIRCFTPDYQFPSVCTDRNGSMNSEVYRSMLSLTLSQMLQSWVFYSADQWPKTYQEFQNAKKWNVVFFTVRSVTWSKPSRLKTKHLSHILFYFRSTVMVSRGKTFWGMIVHVMATVDLFLSFLTDCSLVFVFCGAMHRHNNE